MRLTVIHYYVEFLLSPKTLNDGFNILRRGYIVVVNRIYTDLWSVNIMQMDNKTTRDKHNSIQSYYCIGKLSRINMALDFIISLL